MHPPMRSISSLLIASPSPGATFLPTITGIGLGELLEKTINKLGWNARPLIDHQNSDLSAKLLSR